MPQLRAVPATERPEEEARGSSATSRPTEFADLHYGRTRPIVTSTTDPDLTQETGRFSSGHQNGDGALSATSITRPVRLTLNPPAQTRPAQYE